MPGPAVRIGADGEVATAFQRAPDIVPASGGYHDAAIREERSRKP